MTHSLMNRVAARWAAIIFLIALSGCAATHQDAAPSAAADLIVTHAKIATLDPQGRMAQALAVRDGRLIAVGSDAEVRALAGAQTRIVDAGGRTVIPGLIDSHLHGVRAALSYATEVNWIGARTIAEAMQRLRDKAAASGPGAWLIVAGGWSEQQFAEKRRPTLDEVMSAVPDNPAWIQLFYEAVLVTPKARALLNLDERQLPSGVTAERDAAGQPTGWWAASIIATSSLFDRLPKPGYADNLVGTRQFFTELNRLGVTGFVDTGGFNIEAPQYAALFQLWRDKAMTVRVAYYLFAQKRGVELEEYQRQTQFLPMGVGDDMLKFNGIGERITLAMYNNNAPSPEVRDKFYEAIRWAAERRMTLTVHWTEASSVNTLLDLFERVNREVTPIAPLRWSIAHLEDATPQVLARMASLGVAWSTQLGTYYGGHALLEKRGEDARRMPALVTGMNAGVKVALGTDAHRVASYNPFVVLQWVLDGRAIDGTLLRVASEIPTRDQALRMYTLNAAWFSFDENRRGSLEVGKLADFSILSQDYFSVPVEEIGNTTSVMTVVGGAVVYTTLDNVQITP